MLFTDQLPGRTAHLYGESWLYFSGTSYLGIAQNTDFQNILYKSIHQYGANFGGSRLSNLRFNVFEQAENHFAQGAGAEAALTVSSGTLAGQLVVKALKKRGKFYFAPGVHPALFGEGDYSALSFKHWSDYILHEAQRGEPMVLFSNALDPLRSKKLDFNWLFEIKKETAVTLVLDDSHGIGLTGKDGSGIFSILQNPENVEVVAIASLGKALAIPGGVILSSEQLIREFWQSPYFGGASPVIPAYLDAFLKSQHLYQRARQILFRNVYFFAEATKEFGLFENLADYPVFYTSKNELADYLQQHKVLISSFSYPTSQDDRITRVVLSAAHTLKDLEQLVALIRQFISA